METTTDRLSEKHLLHFEYHIAEHCNLNCAGCDHFSPLAGAAFPAIEDIERDLLRIRDLFGVERIGRIHILGGEPLLNLQVCDYLRMTRAIFPGVRMELVTNGLLLPKMDEYFWITCAETSTILRPTKYPIAIDYRGIEASAAAHGVACRYFNAEPVRTFYRLHLDPTGSQNGVQSFSSCGMSNNCLMLKNGRIYTCPVIPNIEHFNRRFGNHFFVSERDSISIYDATKGDEILAFAAEPCPFCRYCNVIEKEYGLPWRVSEQQPAEWISEELKNGTR